MLSNVLERTKTIFLVAPLIILLTLNSITFNGILTYAICMNTSEFLNIAFGRGSKNGVINVVSISSAVFSITLMFTFKEFGYCGIIFCYICHAIILTLWGVVKNHTNIYFFFGVLYIFFCYPLLLISTVHRSKVL